MCVCVSVVLYIFDCECAHFYAKYILSVLHYWFDTSCCNYHCIFNLSVCCFIHIPSPPPSPPNCSGRVANEEGFDDCLPLTMALFMFMNPPPWLMGDPCGI